MIKPFFIILLIFALTWTPTQGAIDSARVAQQCEQIKKISYTNIDSANILSQQLEVLIDSLDNFKMLKIQVVNRIAITYSLVGDNAKAYQYFILNTKIDTSGVDPKTLGDIYNNAGIIKMDFGMYADAIQYFLISQKYRQNSKQELAASYSNIGLCYYRQNFQKKAEKSYKKALSLLYDPEITDSSLYAKIHSNLALLYLYAKQIDSAEHHIRIALKMQKAIKEVYDLCGTYSYMSEVFFAKQQLDSAYFFIKKSLILSKSVGSWHDYYFGLIDLANYYYKTQQYSKIKPILDSCYTFFKDNQYSWEIANMYDFYSDYYQKTGELQKALSYKDSLIALNDSLFSIESLNKQKQLEAIFETEKQQIAINSLKKENHAKNLLLSKEKSLKLAYAGGLSFSIILLGFLFYNYREKLKAQQLIEHQKHVVDLKNKEITDSINYAKHIQKSFIPSIKEINTHLNNFIVYKPKDIVSGDFYWMEIMDNYLFFAAADCTGHGVPGAMVSVVCSNALSKVVIEEKELLTDKILNRVRTLIIERFARSGENIYDGMDISLCRLNKDTLELQWSGANNPLYIIRNNELIEIKADKQPVGKSIKHLPFTAHTIQLQKGDTIYLFTDGFADQFGGPKGKKFKYKAFKELLLSIQDKTMEQQRETLYKTFTEWKGNLEQVDDVCIFGVRI